MDKIIEEDTNDKSQKPSRQVKQGSSKVVDKRVMTVLTGVTILCVVDIIVMVSDPFSAFTVLPFFLLPIYFLSLISVCLIVAQLGKRFPF